MLQFVGEKIEVEHDGRSPRPVSFRIDGDRHDVAEVVHEWVDTGYGTLPPHSRTWYNRRHRRYYMVRDTVGELFTMYFDYADRRRPSWWLVSRTS